MDRPLLDGASEGYQHGLTSQRTQCQVSPQSHPATVTIKFVCASALKWKILSYLVDKLGHKIDGFQFTVLHSCSPRNSTQHPLHSYMVLASIIAGVTFKNQQIHIYQALQKILGFFNLPFTTRQAYVKHPSNSDLHPLPQLIQSESNSVAKALWAALAVNYTLACDLL